MQSSNFADLPLDVTISQSSIEKAQTKLVNGILLHHIQKPASHIENPVMKSEIIIFFMTYKCLKQEQPMCSQNFQITFVFLKTSKDTE